MTWFSRCLSPALFAAAIGACGESPAEGPTGTGTLSHFTERLDGTERTIDCTRLDRTVATLSVAYGALGGVSESTSIGFSTLVPLTAAKLRDPSLLARYALTPWGATPDDTNDGAHAFELALKLVDEAGSEWYSCPTGCDEASSNNYHEVTSIREVAKGAGTSTFRVSGSFAADVATLAAPTMATPATGEWSLELTVPNDAPGD